MLFSINSTNIHNNWQIVWQIKPFKEFFWWFCRSKTTQINPVRNGFDWHFGFFGIFKMALNRLASWHCGVIRLKRKPFSVKQNRAIDNW